ncbi:MAG: acyl transferase [Bacteroidetes bacterium 43-16]|nr:MAG: acyl transferase [Bacteroidetes bacterium 43-16]
MLDHLSSNIAWLKSINAANFEQRALELFRHQYKNTILYRDYCNHLNRKPENVHTIAEIPFLPISFFKSHKVLAQGRSGQLLFESSGTTGMTPSRHYIAQPGYYETAFRKGFHDFYGAPEDYIILGLLPSYLERKHSSLVYMVQDLIQSSAHPLGGFYLNEWEQIAAILQQAQDRKIFLIGVTFALLDFAETFPMDLSRHIVMETGGMKGRREEWTRMEVHAYLGRQWNLDAVHSEYGMSEMLSQAYSKGKGVFHCTATMKILLRDENDPLENYFTGSGCVNVIDLANIDSCAFIATEDIGKVAADGSFEILGRRDTAALRGCSLMVI